MAKFHIIPPLYHLARSRGRPMTTLVADAIQEYVARQELAPIADQIAVSERGIARHLRCRPALASDVRPT